MSIKLRLFCLCMGCWVAVANAQQTPFMSQIETSTKGVLPSPVGEKIVFDLVIDNPVEYIQTLSQWPDIKLSAKPEGGVQIALPKRIVGKPKLKQDYLTNSFVIDIQEPATQSFVKGYASEARHSLESIEQYVADYITDTTYIHGFNIASKVAAQKSGDCTEHAVLTTTLARSLKLPSRVVLGTVIIIENGEAMAFGHAWSEVLHQEQWHIVDAALYELDNAEQNSTERFYLPSGTLDDEGPGFSFSLINSIANLPHGISNLRT